MPFSGCLVPVQARRPVLFACSEMIELMEEPVSSLSDPSSSPTRARIQRLRPLLSDNDAYIKVQRIVCLPDLSDVKKWTQLLRSTDNSVVFLRSCCQPDAEECPTIMCSLECCLGDPANKEPARAFALQTLIIAVVTCRFARWAFGPIFLTDCALIYSRASMRARHAPALPIGKDNVLAGRSTACTDCDWFRALHVLG